MLKIRINYGEWNQSVSESSLFEEAPLHWHISEKSPAWSPIFGPKTSVCLPHEEKSFVLAALVYSASSGARIESGPPTFPEHISDDRDMRLDWKDKRLG